MQKDFHFYVTYLLATRAGIAEATAQKIAWACQFTDELQDPGSHDIQTQSGLLGNWLDRQIQLTVLIAFHFMPGDDSEWVVRRNSSRARKLINSAAGDSIQLGIALHTLQDTFSHEGFSGWREPVNACFPWYDIRGFPPSVGHAEMIVVPDIISQTWTDPRTGKVHNNRAMALDAARVTYGCLRKFSNANPDSWGGIEPELASAFFVSCYDDRKQAIIDLCQDGGIRYSGVHQRLLPKYRNAFVMAAKEHLGRAMILCANVASKPETK